MSLEYLKARNNFGNSENRSSFSIEIHKCHENNPKCRSEEEIDKLLDIMMFNMYILSERSENKINQDKSPIFA
jgi:hypothetical protein